MVRNIQSNKTLKFNQGRQTERSITIDNFKKDNTTSEVYHYGQTKEGEFSLVLAFKLATNFENAKKAAINAVQNGRQNETVDQLPDLFFIETNDWYDSIRRIENSLLCKK